MASIARNYKNSEVKALFSLSGNECANPECNNKMIGEGGTTVLGEICHISAANEKGPRYDSNLNDNQRRLYDNLILLCPNCHKKIDDSDEIDKYSIEALKSWKENHVDRMEQSRVDEEIVEELAETIYVEQKFTFEHNITLNENNKGDSQFDEFLIKNLYDLRKAKGFDLKMFGFVIFFAVGTFIFLIIHLYHFYHGDKENLLNLLRILPILPVKFCYGSWRVSRYILQDTKYLENKYDKWIEDSSNGKLNPEQHLVLSKEFNKLRKIK